MKATEIHFETLAVANLVLTKKLLAAIVSTRALDEETIIGILVNASEEITRSTLPISLDGAKQALGLFLAGTGIDPRSIWPDY